MLKVASASGRLLAPTLPPRPFDDAATMLDVDEARARILDAVAPLPSVRVPLDEALGLTLTVDVIAGADLPPFANAAMDGFAVRAADTLGADVGAGILLRVVGEAPAGAPPTAEVGLGQAVRIMTGAPMPRGADAVVRFEDTDEVGPTSVGQGQPGGRIGILKPARVGANIRPAGEDVRRGDTVLLAGTRLRPAEIGLLASLNRLTATVHRRPRVAVLATGDEVVDPGDALGPGQIRNSNGPMLAAMVRRCGGEVVSLGVARDSEADLRAKLHRAAGADLLITAGGVSVGDYDLVKQVLRREGRIDLWQVRIKPGKPLAFGRIGDTPLLGLPGNPVAAAVAFEQFARPALAKMVGRRDVGIPTVPARLTDRVENRGGRRHYARVRVVLGADGYVARLAGPQGAGILSALAGANGLMVIPEEVAVAEPGASFPVQMLDWEID